MVKLQMDRGMRTSAEVRNCPKCADGPMRLVNRIEPHPVHGLGFELQVLRCDPCGHRLSETVKLVDPEPHLVPRHWRCSNCGLQMEIRDRIRPHPSYGADYELLKLVCMGCGRRATADVWAK